MDSSNSPSTKPLYRGTQIIWYIVSIVEILLIFRVFLKATSANANAPFTSFIYEVTNPIASPFLRVFSTTQVEGAIIEWTTILAMFVYWILALGIINLLLMGKTISTLEASEKLDKQERI
ncbi:YggT family protein [Candidatus Gracilibacteria bacterium]|nr:YggT family protein [Candidatus Gracilibacteria bacterium]